MKTLFLLLVLNTTLLLSASLRHVTLGNQDFTITTESYKVYDSKGTVMRLYSEERNNDLLFILSLTLHDSTGACTDKNIEEGSYERNATHITLYTSWERRGKAYDTPNGARIQVYAIQENQTLKRISSKLYIETHRRNYNENSGMKFLFTPPKTEKEKKQLALYIRNVERKYKGTFIFADAAKKLTQDVKSALVRKMKSTWK